MCMDNLKSYNNKKDLKVYKVVFRLKNESLVSIKGHLKEYISNYVYSNGMNYSDTERGLHSFKHKKTADVFINVVKSLSVKHIKDDVKSVCLLSATIPSDAKIQIGTTCSEKNICYISDKLIVNNIPLKEFPIKYNSELFRKALDDYGFFDDI